MDNQTLDLTKKYYINPAYLIIPDKTRAIISNAKGFDILYPKGVENTSISWLLNPLYALIFSFFDGSKNLSEVIEAIAHETGFDSDNIQTMLKPFINNAEPQIIRYTIATNDENKPTKDCVCAVPRRFLIENINGQPRKDLYAKENFYIKKELWDFENFRLSRPINLTLMLNNKCVTDCIYCYANKEHQVQNALSTDKILALIKEASDIGVLTFDISGGEVLHHKDCYVILSELLKFGYLPYVSTKMPLTEQQIIKLKETGVTRIQISVDAWDADILSKLLGVNNEYFHRLKNTLQLLEKYDFDVSVKSVITQYNCNINLIELLLNNLIKFKNISRISIAPGEYSLYKDFLNYKFSIEQWNPIVDFVRSFAQKITDITIGTQGVTRKNDIINGVDVKSAAFTERGLCSGNITSLYILPDGKVTICEELYWLPKFIIGNVGEQSIMDVWNSEKAVNLYKLSQKDFRDTSACKHCLVFTECRSKLGVCWKMILQAYGTEAWDLPDPRCPLAPPPVNEFYR